MGSCCDAGGLAGLDCFRDADARVEDTVAMAHGTVLESETEVSVAVALAAERHGTEELTQAAMTVGTDHVALRQFSVG